MKVLGQKIDETCKLADTLSSKVRHLDTIRDRVRVVSKKVEDIVQVKNCINGVHSAIEAEDWEKACAYIGTYLSIDCSMLEPRSHSLFFSSSGPLFAFFSSSLILMLFFCQKCCAAASTGDRAVASGDPREIRGITGHTRSKGHIPFCQALHPSGTLL